MIPASPRGTFWGNLCQPQKEPAQKNKKKKVQKIQIVQSCKRWDYDGITMKTLGKIKTRQCYMPSYEHT